MAERGLFVVFEGIDGCGKTTQIWNLARYIFDLDKHNHVILTREPYTDANIRTILRQDDDPYSQAEKLTNLFISDRRIHAEELILPNTRKGFHVLSDRYSFSTFAYQQTQGMELSKLLEMHKGLPIPDLIFVIDVPVAKAFERMKKRGGKDGVEQKFEQDKKFIEKLRKNFLKLSKLDRHKVVFINNTKNAEIVFEK